MENFHSLEDSSTSSVSYFNPQVYIVSQVIPSSLSKGFTSEETERFAEKHHLF